MSATDITRTFSLPTQRTTTSSFWNLATRKWSAPVTSVSMQSGHTGAESRRGYVTPGYNDALARGDLPENTFSYYRTERKLFDGMYSFEKINQERRSVTGSFSPVFCNLVPDYSLTSIRRFNLVNGTKQKLLERVRDSDVNLAVAYAERERTLAMLTNSVKRLGIAYSRAKRGNFAGAAQALGIQLPQSLSRGGPVFRRGQGNAQRRSIAKGWLELQYGWRPLLSDIYGGIKFLEKSRVAKKEYVIVRAQKELREESTQLVTTAEFIDTILTSETFVVKCMAKMKSTTSVFRTLSSLGITNPALVFWELVPFSFVVDWAVPIGSFLSQFDSTLGWEFHTGSITTALEQTTTLTRSSAGPTGYTYHHVSGQASDRTFNLDRVGIGVFAQFLSVPYIKSPASVEHALNALALLTSKR